MRAGTNHRQVEAPNPPNPEAENRELGRYPQNFPDSLRERIRYVRIA
jgi:hypothetical protein